jgi:hypothetical protein
MAEIKISQLTAKAANLDVTDLLEVSEVSGLSYVSKKITGQEIIDGVLSYTTLQSVTDAGNTTSNDIQFDAGVGILLDNGSRLREGTIDAGTGGTKGIAQICGVGYELKWEAGSQYVMDSNGTAIRIVNYKFNTAPTVNDDDTKGFYVGSRWILDDGTVYTCLDSHSGVAVWALENIYVPYTGATGNVNLGEYELKAGQLALDTSPTGTAAVGTTRWNDSLGSTETTLKGGSVILKNGVDLVARVVNKVTPNATLTKAAYPVVRVSGAQGSRLAVAYAQANNDNNSADTLGVVCETIATNQEGFILTVGQLEEVNTTGSLQSETWADGDVLYLSPTTPGAITNIKPTGATGHIVIIGYVEYAHAVHGKIYVKIMNGWELDELHNVYINTGTLVNNQVLTYESSTQLWKNKSIPCDIQLAASDETTALTAGTAKVTFRMPYAMTVTAVRASLTTAQTSGSIFTVDINEGGTSILSTKLTIDNTEKTSVTAATPPVISDTALADDAEMTIDIDQIGDGTAKGLKVTIIGTRV